MVKQVSFKNPFVRWVDNRLPIFSLLVKEYGEFPMPRNINYWWSFGAIASVTLIIMIVSGIFLAMSYVPNEAMAFDSVQRIMRDVNWGWLLRYMHANGASLFFVAVYLHMLRSMYYGSYKEPRELLWIIGVVIFLVMILTAFFGYVLPWGQMSFWAATVITNLFSAIPFVGQQIVEWLWGGFAVGNPTLNRFFSLHYLLPFVLLALVAIHVWALHVTKSNNPAGIEPKSSDETVPFFPYVLVKDSVALIVFAIVFAAFVFYAPEVLNHPDNYIKANPLQTPTHIVPEWYFLPFYSILRAVPDILFIPAKLAGVIALFGSILLLFLLPWLDTSKVRSCRFRPVYSMFLFLFFANFVFLGWLGAQAPDGIYLILARIATFWYYAHFLLVAPLVGKFEKTLPVPSSLKAVLTALLISVAVFGGANKATAAETINPLKLSWSFEGPLGNYDRAQLQRGLLVYRKVCASCHALEHVKFRNLRGIGYSVDQIKTIASDYAINEGYDLLGEEVIRAGLPTDAFPNPFVSDEAAKSANAGSLPPDLSLMAASRVGGVNYIYSLLLGYQDAPTGFDVGTGYYNIYMPGNIIAMAPQLIEELELEYEDGTPATVDNYARDVAAFLKWTSDPYLEARHKTGLTVLIFLFILLGLVVALQRKLGKKAFNKKAK